MPYIDTKEKQKFGDIYRLGALAQSSGELNYLFTTIIKGYLGNKGLRYQFINDIIGALDACKLEFYRRTVSHYEDIKIEQMETFSNAPKNSKR